ICGPGAVAKTFTATLLEQRCERHWGSRLPWHRRNYSAKTTGIAGMESANPRNIHVRTHPTASKTLDRRSRLAVMERSMKRSVATFFLALATCASATAAEADEVIPHRQDQPPNKPYSPQE